MVRGEKIRTVKDKRAPAKKKKKSVTAGGEEQRRRGMLTPALSL